MNGLFEILSNKEWMISREFLHSILPTLQYNITNHASLGIEREKKSPMVIGQQGQDFIREYQVTEDGSVLPDFDAWDGSDILGKMKEPFVNVIPVDGPITRNGGACSYGSRDIRDWMMHAADNKFCQGHVLHINTPGGSVWAKNDFQQGIDYAHEHGQRVIAFIDGLCASAGMYLAALCDEVYVMNPKDQLGCVGVMAAFFTMKNGERDPYTGETYREYYDPESVDKNKEMRDIAEDEDATLLIEELKKLGEEFRTDMKASFPDADVDEHLRGKIFDAEKVMGILCDGQMMLGDVISRVFNLANGSEQPIERTAGHKIEKQADTEDEEQDQKAPATGEEKNVSPKNSTTMTDKKYQKITQLLGVDELAVTEGGTFLNVALLDSMEEKLEQMEAGADGSVQAAQEQEAAGQEGQEAGAAAGEGAAEGAAEGAGEGSGNDAGEGAGNGEGSGEGEGTGNGEGEGAGNSDGSGEGAGEQHSQEAEQNAQADIDKITETLHNAEQMVADKDKEIASLKESLATLNGIAEERDAATKERDEANAALDEKAGKLTEAESKIAEHVATIEKLTKQVSDLKAEIKVLSSEEKPMIDSSAGEAPAGNGTGEAPKYDGIKSVVKPDMSAEEIRAALRKQDEEMNARNHRR